MENNLREFILTKLAVDEEDILPETRIEEDLGIYGDEAMEFITAFAKEFNVNISHFMAAEYFSPEGDFILPAIFRMLTGRKKKKQKTLKIIHLENAIKEGRLDEEVINRASLE